MDSTLDNRDNTLTSERFRELAEALEVLYIVGNISGRLKFAQAWPVPALFIFGEELTVCDREGTKDREKRKELEEEAEHRRAAFFEIVQTLEAKSVFEGALQVEYTGGLVREFGRPLALHLYARRIVDRFIPPTPEELAAEAPPPEEAKPVPAPAPEEEAPLPVIDDIMDSIQPISVEPPLPVEAAPAPVPEIVAFQPDEEEEDDKPLFVAITESYPEDPKQPEEQKPEEKPKEDQPAEKPSEEEPAPRKSGLNLTGIKDAGSN